MKQKLFAYDYLDTPIHRMSGLTKFICFLLLSFAVMFSYDIRAVAGVLLLSLAAMRSSKIKMRQISLMLVYVLIFLLINAVVTYFFSPGEGTLIYGTRHLVFGEMGRYSLTWEQLFYQATKLLKYAAIVPLGILFLLTTNPSELASSLNGAGVSYKAAFAVALTLRYFPDIMRDYNDISLAQQARGLELSGKAKLLDRLKNSAIILLPLIFSTLDRVELISNAMDLRGFGKLKKRTWYSRKHLARLDYMAIIVCAAVFLATVLVSVFINHSRFYNPFV